MTAKKNTPKIAPAKHLHSAGISHIGRRHSNEDGFFRDERLGLFVVADGMGGYAGGEVASDLAIDALATFIRRNHADDNVTWPYGFDGSLSLEENMVAVAVRLANDRIALRRIGELAQMGSTISLLLVREGRIIIGHIGDSRVYRVRDGSIEQLTSDHTLYAQLIAEGHDLPPPSEYPYSNIVTRALGACGNADVLTEPVRAGDRFVLCTDGLTGPLSDDAIARIVATNEPDRAAELLVEGAYAAGGSDNITAVVVAISHRASHGDAEAP